MTSGNRTQAGTVLGLTMTSPSADAGWPTGFPWRDGSARAYSARVAEPLAVAADGERLLRFEFCSEAGVEEADPAPLTASLVIVQRDDAVLLVYDRWKQSWELPGGGREAGSRRAGRRSASWPRRPGSRRSR